MRERRRSSIGDMSSPPVEGATARPASRVVSGLLLAIALTAAACGGGSDENHGATADFSVGMILVGAKDDQGWSQAHYEAGRHVVTSPAAAAGDRAARR